MSIFLCKKYLNTLCSLRLVKRIIPCNEETGSRKSIYWICDNYFQFWYHILFKQKSFYEFIGEEKSAEDVMKNENINLYMGRILEEICLEYMIRFAKNQMILKQCFQDVLFFRLQKIFIFMLSVKAAFQIEYVPMQQIMMWHFWCLMICLVLNKLRHKPHWN